MRILFIFLLLAAPAFAEEQHPEQWQYEESLEVPPGPIPRDRCIRALYLSDELRAERGVRSWEQWDAPITEAMASWLVWYRDNNSVRLFFCDQDAI
ncbi:MAG: hypothetical protein RIM33_02750 [Alphaproteobacteria bacterium]